MTSMTNENKPVCPESMLHVRDMLIESRIPDWVKESLADPACPRHRAAVTSNSILREFAEIDTDHYLSTLDAAGFSITQQKIPPQEKQCKPS